MANKKNMSVINEVSSVSAFTYDRHIFPTCLDWILSKITKNKWALFYCLPNKSLKEGLKLIHIDNDVHSFFADAESHGKIHLYIAHKKQELGMYYFRNMVGLEEDAGVEDVGLVQEKADVGKKEGVGRKVQGATRKEFVEWAEQQAGTPYLRTPPLKPRRKGIEFPCKNLFGYFFLHCDSVAGEFVLNDDWNYEGLSVDGYIDVVGSSQCSDLVHERVGYNGHSLPNMDKECFLNDVVLDAVVLEKKCRSKVSVTRKRRSWKKSLRKGHGKKVRRGAKNQRCGSLSGLNVQAGDDDQQVTTQEEKTAGDDDPQVNNKVSVHV
ncbi:hypothetical protein Tco_0331133 [Tanacetum coccineum]